MKRLLGLLVLTCFWHVGVSAHASELEDVVKLSHRSDDNKHRDQYRHPVQTLKFFGLKPHHRVLEMLPGDGWYSEIIAPYVKDKGQLTAVTFAIDNLNSNDKKKAFYSKYAIRYREKMAEKSVYGSVTFTEFDPPRVVEIAPANSADFALVVRVLHVWDESGHMKEGFDTLYQSLKPGGVLGVVQHRSDSISKLASSAAEGYLDERYVIAVAEGAGFQLVAKSEINANEKDTKDYPKGVYALLPTLAMGTTDRGKYLAIGESDRMTLKFVKPVTK
jgi:predicted methyltransferase